MLRQLNQDIRRREQIIGIPEPTKETGGIRRFTAGYEVFKTLLAENFIDPTETQNDSPAAIDFIEFLRDNPTFEALGYTVALYRDDYRINIEGVQKKGPYNKDELQAFLDLCAKSPPDEHIVNPQKELFAWWD